MPIVYEGTCPHCGRESFELDYAYGVMRDDDTVVMLPHPCESDHIKDHGFTWPDAWLEGRIIKSDTKVCSGCGEVHGEQALQPPGYVESFPPPRPRGLQMWAPVIGGLGVAWYFNSILHGLAVAIAVLLLFEWAHRGRELREATARTAAKRTRWASMLALRARCASCGGNQFKRVFDAIDTPDVRCPHCGTRTLTLRCWGIA